jgi:outer membrane protein OmpA-like peptidoglycan-associated protein
MRKVNVISVWIVTMIMTAVLLFPSPGPGTPAGEEKVVKRYKLRKALVYREEMLMLSDTDIYCTYFIRNKIPRDLYVTGGVNMDWMYTFSEFDRVFINKGTSEGINEGDTFLVLGEGRTITSRLTGKKLGTYYIGKSLGDVTCVYENNAEVTLRKNCHPVEVGDVLIPYKPQETIRHKKLEYRLCKLPKTPIEGRVVYIDLYLDSERDIVASNEYLTVDMGKAMLSRGDWLLFYKMYRDDLPPVIIGSGIVVHAENTNSTVKIIDDAIPIETGNYAVLLQEGSKIPRFKGEEDEEFPLIEKQATQKKEEREIPEGKDVLELNILFDIDETAIQDQYKQELEDIREFIAAKPAYEVILRGYCCSIGGFEYNLKLSQKRVEAVKKYLMETFNIKEEAFETYHYGEKEAPFDNTTEEERRKNRRVNIQVIEK